MKGLFDEENETEKETVDEKRKGALSIMQNVPKQGGFNKETGQPVMKDKETEKGAVTEERKKEQGRDAHNEMIGHAVLSKKEKETEFEAGKKDDTKEDCLLM